MSYDIIANRWLGISNPDPHLNSHPTQNHSQKVFKMLVFSLFHWIIMDGQIVKTSFRLVWSQLLINWSSNNNDPLKKVSLLSA